MKMNINDRLRQICEPGVLPLVLALYEKGYNTYSSCEGRQICRGQMVYAGSRDDGSDALYANEPLFTTPFVALVTRIANNQGEVYARITNGIPALQACLGQFNRTAKIRWMLNASGWNDGEFDTIKPDIERIDGYGNRGLVQGDLQALINVRSEITLLSSYLKKHLHSIIQ